MNRRPASRCRDGSTCRRTRRVAASSQQAEGRCARTRPDRATRADATIARDDLGRGPAGRALVCRARAVRPGPPRKPCRRRRASSCAPPPTASSRGDLAARVAARSPRIQFVDDAAISAQVVLTSARPGNVVAELVLAAARRRAAAAPIRRPIVRRGGRRGRAHHRRDARSDAEADVAERPAPLRRRNAESTARRRRRRSRRAIHAARRGPSQPRRPPPSKPSRRPRRSPSRAAQFGV